MTLDIVEWNLYSVHDRYAIQVHIGTLYISTLLLFIIVEASTQMLYLLILVRFVVGMLSVLLYSITVDWRL